MQSLEILFVLVPWFQIDSVPVNLLREVTLLGLVPTWLGRPVLLNLDPSLQIEYVPFLPPLLHEYLLIRLNTKLLLILSLRVINKLVVAYLGLPFHL